MTRHEAILKITDYLREHRVDPKTPVGVAFDGDSPMRGCLLMLEALGLVRFDDEAMQAQAFAGGGFNVRSSTIPVPEPPDQYVVVGPFPNVDAAVFFMKNCAWETKLAKRDDKR
jgi:hypothetical protein